MKYEETILKIKEEFPNLKICKKEDSRFMKLLSFFFFIISLGKVNNFLSQYTTAIGSTIYVPNNWVHLSDKYKSIILRHELVHMRQMKKHTTVFFLFAYFFLPLPMFFSFCRARFEWEAYEESLKAEYELHGDRHLKKKEYKEAIIQLFIGRHYGWMWPFRKKVEKWYDSFVLKIST